MASEYSKQKKCLNSAIGGFYAIFPFFNFNFLFVLTVEIAPHRKPLDGAITNKHHQSLREPNFQET